MKFFKNITAARTNSGWLAFMLPRLKLARDLLKDDGVIFISIDDNEQANLKLLCDEIFGEDNFVSCFVWEKTQHFGKQKENFYSNCEYILCYAKNKYDSDGKQKRLLVENIQTEFDDAPLYNASNNKHIMNFPKNSCIFKIEDNTYTQSDEQDKYELLDYVIVKNGTNTNDFRIRFKSRWSDKTLQNELAKGAKVLIKSTKFAPRMIYADNKEFIVSPKSLIFTNLKNPFCAKFKNIKVGTNENGTAEVSNLLGKEIFNYPKPVSLLAYLIGISTSANKSIQRVKTPCCQGLQTLENNNNVASAHCVQNTDKTNEEFSKSLKVAEPSEISNEVIDNSEPDIILDFFAGSGTTAQAVMELNSEDKANREFILVQIEEKIDEKKSKTAFDFCKNELKSVSPVISDITIERVKRATKKLQDKAVGVENLGFKVFALDDKPKIFEKENGGEEKILELIDKRNLNKMDIIINMSLISGKTLDKKIETIFDGKLYKLEDSYYLINCDREILKYLIKTKNEYIFIDAYGDMELEDFLNLGAEFKERLIAVY